MDMTGNSACTHLMKSNLVNSSFLLQEKGKKGHGSGKMVKRGENLNGRCVKGWICKDIKAKFDSNIKKKQ